MFRTIIILLGVFPAAVLSQFCGGWASLSDGQFAKVTSPNYPYFYNWGSKCEWLIQSKMALTMTISCFSINILATKQGCGYDYLSVAIDGDAFFKQERKFCGSFPFTFTIKSNIFRVRFVSAYNNFFFPNKYFTGFSCIVFASDVISSDSLNATTSTTTTTTSTSSLVSNNGASLSTPASSNYSAPCVCGIKGRSRIVNGQNADLHEYLWQVAITYKSGTQYCGGTLISSEYVLTARHCVENIDESNIMVNVGDYAKYLTNETSFTVRVGVSKIIMFQHFKDNYHDNDIALIKLDRQIAFNDAIAPVCLPFNNWNTSLTGETGTVIGWGTLYFGAKVSSNILQEVDLKILESSECSKYFPGQVTQNMICTYSPGKDSCQGDSGGPLIWENNGRHYIVGIVSWGVGCALPRYPGVYTKVSKYIDWIQENTDANFCKI